MHIASGDARRYTHIGSSILFFSITAHHWHFKGLGGCGKHHTTLRPVYPR